MQHVLASLYTWMAFWHLALSTTKSHWFRHFCSKFCHQCLKTFPASHKQANNIHIFCGCITDKGSAFHGIQRGGLVSLKVSVWHHAHTNWPWGRSSTAHNLKGSISTTMLVAIATTVRLLAKLAITYNECHLRDPQLPLPQWIYSYIPSYGLAGLC